MFFSPEVLLDRIIGLIIGLSLHEWAHAWTAYRLGDTTAYFQGRLTLNPRAHIDLIGIFLASGSIRTLLEKGDDRDLGYASAGWQWGDL